MRDYVIATDSCCDFDENLIRELELTVIPLSVQLGKALAAHIKDGIIAKSAVSCRSMADLAFAHTFAVEDLLFREHTGDVRHKAGGPCFSACIHRFD